MGSDLDENRESNEAGSDAAREEPQHEGNESVTRRIESQSEQPTEIEEPEKQTVLDKLRGAYARARDGRNRAAATGNQSRSAKTKDRSKTLLVLALSVVLMLFAFVAMFSHSTRGKESAARRTTPSLGRPEAPTNGTAEKRGSVTPLQSADTSGQEGSGDQVSAEDVHNTAKVRLRPAPRQTLADVPPMDPALEAYRQTKQGYPPPPPAPQPVTTASTPIKNESDSLKKASLVFVRNTVTSSSGASASTAASPQPALLERRSSSLLPNGSRLVARLQAAASTAVRTPVVAAVEYNYERDGEIVVPAGTKAFGELQQANRNGIVSVRFHTLEMPDGTSERIDGTAMSLEYGPLKGAVSGSNKAKRILVRSLTGVGTMAAYLVGGPGGFSGASGQLNNSILLRERIASNAGLAGEQEMMNLALNEQIVVTLPANTRFFIVLQDSGGERTPARITPAGSQPGVQYAASGNAGLPTAQELRELIELKSELNRMYREAAPTRPAEATPVAQSQQQ
jgi:hypothetical protein